MIQNKADILFGMDLADYVLSRFDKTDRVKIEDAFDDVCDAVKIAIEEDINKAMNKYN